jgi:DNA-binding NarL/FixJ family response regulator
MKAAPKSVVTPTRVLRVVVVDDSEVFRRALGEFLALMPDLVVVAEASDGEAGIAAVARTAPDVVLMDVRMPGTGGLEATRHLKRAAGCPWVVLLTLNDSEHLQHAAAEVGADGLLGKGQLPERLPELLRALRAADAGEHHDK